MAHEDLAPRYVAQALRCWACAERDSKARDATETNKGKSLPGVYWSVGEKI